MLIAQPNEVIVRMYRHGLGDCYLLAFGAESDDASCKYVLIDCGVHKRQREGAQRLMQVMKDIVSATGGGHLHALVVTHEHADHISGFVQKGSPFLKGEITTDQVWMAWTEKPGDIQAATLRKKKRKSQEAVDAALTVLREKSRQLKVADPATVDRSWVERRAKSVRYSIESIKKVTEFDSFSDVDDTQVLSYLAAVGAQDTDNGGPVVPESAGDTGEHTVFSAAKRKVRHSPNHLAMTLVASLGEPHYCEPGDMLNIADVANLRVHVLGPPRTEKLLKKDRPGKVRGGGKHEYKEVYMSDTKPMFGLSPVLYADSDHSVASLSSYRTLPFPGSAQFDAAELNGYRCIDDYTHEKEQWRHLGTEWLGEASSLALAMDSDTNNTSLVLAFELGEPGVGDVLLFCGDAQVGNWLSWRDQQYGSQAPCTADDLMGRTLLYKVGHHGSHNATIRRDFREDENFPDGDPCGVALMNDMISMINVDKSAVSRKMPVVWRMPHEPLYHVLRDKSNYRVLRADDELSPLSDSDVKDVVPGSSEFEKTPGLDHVQWRASEAQFGSSPDIALYYDIKIDKLRSRNSG